MTAAQAPRRSEAEQARLETTLTELFERRQRFNQTMGLRVHRLDRHGVTLTFDMRPDLVGHDHYERLHGGVISATLDATGGAALLVALAEKHADETTEQVMHRYSRFGTIDLRVDYLRPGLGRNFIASAEVIRLGGRIGSTQMRLVNDAGTLVATGAAAYVIS
ncbi:MAG: hypothetical protein RIQ60_4087 [Pseudomonadota bacterium]|jgi:uncharacterized protein (TIGR00369 family)